MLIASFPWNFRGIKLIFPSHAFFILINRQCYLPKWAVHRFVQNFGIDLSAISRVTCPKIKVNLSEKVIIIPCGPKVATYCSLVTYVMDLILADEFLLLTTRGFHQKQTKFGSFSFLSAFLNNLEHLITLIHIRSCLESQNKQRRV